MMSSTTNFYFCAVGVFLMELLLSVIYPSLGARLLFGILAIFLLWKAVTNRAGSNSPIGLYIFISAIYVFAALTEVAYFGNRMNLDPGLMGALTDMGVAFLICAAGGYLLVQGQAEELAPRQVLQPFQVQSAIWFCVVLFVAVAFFIVAAFGFSVGTLSRSEIYSEDLSILGFLRALLAIAVGVTAAILRYYEHSIKAKFNAGRIRLFSVVAGSAFFDLLILGDRRLVLVALLAISAHFLPKRFSKPQVLSAAVLGLALFIYGFVRNTPPETWFATLASGEILAAISPASTEFGGLAIIGQTIGSFKNQVWGFPGYLDAFLQVVPRFLLENRPLSPTEWFMDTFYPALSAAGASYAFNQVVEARLNAGIGGIIAAGFVTGISLAFVSKLRFAGARIGISIAIYIFTFSMRMDFASILRTALFAFLGTAMVLAVIWIFKLRDSQLQTAGHAT